MQSQLVFQEEKERERLRIQNLLLSQAEKPALEHFFKGKSELSVLDIGCNDGARTFHRFSDDRISRVIGLEYNQQLVERANSQFGNTKFFFLSDGCGSGFVFRGFSEAMHGTGRQRI